MTKPITCPCEEFDRDLATDRCHCGHAYEQHSEDDGLVCTATESYPAARERPRPSADAPSLVSCARCGQPLRDDNCPDECDCQPTREPPRHRHPDSLPEARMIIEITETDTGSFDFSAKADADAWPPLYMAFGRTVDQIEFLIKGILGDLRAVAGGDEDAREVVFPERVEPDEPSIFLTIEQVAKRLGMGRTKAYGLIGSGEIPSTTMGRLRRVHPDDLDAYVARIRPSAEAAS